MKDLIVFIDSIEGIEQEKIEISIPKRSQYTGSPVAMRDPIALEYIAAYLEQYGYTTEVLLKALMKNEEIIQNVRNLEGNLLAVCLSMHSTYLVPSTLELARKIKSELPDIPIIVGGYHPTGDPTIVLDRAIDVAVVGEGEKTCKELLDALRFGWNLQVLKNINGISFVNEHGGVTITPPRERLEFSTLPWPKRNEKIHILCQPGPLSYPPVGRVAQIAYSRGCPTDATSVFPQKCGGKR